LILAERHLLPKRVMASDTSPIGSFSEIQELSGKLSPQQEEDKLMRTVLQADQKTKDHGNLIRDSFNRGIGAFAPNLIFRNLVQNYSQARKIYGETFIRLVSGYDESFIRKNINVPEFQRELKKRIEKNIDEMKDQGLLDDTDAPTSHGLKLASLTLTIEELDRLMPKGIIGEKVHKKRKLYGDKEESKDYKRGDLYRSLDIHKSVKAAIRRNHRELSEADLKVFEKKAKGAITVIYAFDASGSMKGEKIDLCKKAGVALCYKAIAERDKVGLIIFGKHIKKSVSPTLDFPLLVEEITRIKPSQETNIQKTIQKSIELFPSGHSTKHLILVTDCMPTTGKDPEKEVLEAASLCHDNNISISLIGIGLDEKGILLARRIVEIGEGRLYLVKGGKRLDLIVLEDYYSLN